LSDNAKSIIVKVSEAVPLFDGEPKNAALIGWRVFVLLGILGMIRCILITEDQVFMNAAKIDVMNHAIKEIKSDVLYIRENQESDEVKAGLRKAP
jgi:hypothetical protein